LATENVILSNKSLCACGCGEEIDVYDKQGRTHQYKNHHGSRKYKKESCLKIPCKCGCGILIYNFDRRGIIHGKE
jgi:hypothetical protein